MYVILGCGRVGARVADLLVEAGKEVFVVDADPARVEALQERQFDSIVGDMLSIKLNKAPFSRAEGFLVMSGTDERNEGAVRHIKKTLKDASVVVRASNPVSRKAMEEAGADYVVETAEIVGAAVVRELTGLELFQKTDRLVSIVQAAGKRGLAIVMHNAPDPDAISSSMALQKIAEKFHVPSTLYYGGEIGHQQNRTLVNLLDVKLQQLRSTKEAGEAMKAHGKVAILDAELPGHNNMLPKSTVPDIVIGHHMTSKPQNIRGAFVDVRVNVGASATILLGYMRELGIQPDAALATALLHGIRVDTAGFTRHTSASDLSAVAYLSPLADPKLLQQIESPPVTVETVDVLGRAIQNRTIRSSYLVTNSGFIKDRDALPQAAEYLLELEGVDTVLTFGIQGETIHLSARSRDGRVNVGDILQKAFGADNAGGHVQSAAGQVPLGILGDTADKDELLELVEEVVTRQFFNAAGVPEGEPPESDEPVTASDGSRRKNGAAARRTKRAKKKKA